MKSYRTSTQSVSKRSSDYSVQSSTKSSSSNSEIAFSISESGGNSSSSTTMATMATMATDYQQLSQQRCTTTTSSTSTTSTGYSSSEMEHTLSSSLGILRGSSPEMAPALPPKTGQRLTRHESAGDEPDEQGWGSHRSSQSELAELRHLGHQAQLQQWHSKHHSLIGSSCYAVDKRNLEEPPPLPMKQKHSKSDFSQCTFI